MFKIRLLAGRLVLFTYFTLIVPALVLGTTEDDSVQKTEVLARIGGYVQRYYDQMQSVVSQETVILHSMSHDARPLFPSRQLVYELRIEWDPVAEIGQRAKAVRELLSVNGRDPRPSDTPSCTDPKAMASEPLAMLLPETQNDYEFILVGQREVDDQLAVLVEYRSIAKASAEVEWSDECITIELEGRTRGRIWAEKATGQVLRFEEALTGPFTVPVPIDQQRLGSPLRLVVERVDTSIRYKPVRFTDPTETLLLPASIDRLTVVKNAGVPRMLMLQSFSRYRRFLTEASIVQ